MDALARFYEILRDQPVLTLFLILALGYLGGRIRIGSFSFGPVTGVLFVGLFFGHHGFRMDAGAQSLGFALFIFSVGYQAGPRFFDVLRTDGLRYFTLAMFVATIGFGVAMVAAGLLQLEPGASAGLLAGGMTSSPTLAAAQEAVRTGSVAPPAGWTPHAMMGNIATGYAITYIFGLAGLILLIKLLPRLLGVDLVAEAREMELEDEGDAAPVNVALRGYRVSDASFTQPTLAELRERYWDRFAVVRIRREGRLLEADPDDHLRLGDEVIALGNTEFFTGGIQAIGEEFAPDQSLAPFTTSAQVVVTHRDVSGRRLGELELSRRYGVLVTSLRRMRLALPRSDDLELRRGDVLSVVGPSAAIDSLGEVVGHVERDIAETDMITFALGVAFGVALGLLSIRVGGISIGLGSAGGLLTSGLAIGFLRSVRPTFGRLPDAARWIFMEFGLLIFMTGVGLRAGGDIIETFLKTGPPLILAGMVVTLSPILLGYLFGRRVLGIRPVLLFGALTGAMTSGASLSVVTAEAQSNIPALGYTGCYAFANVILTVAGSLILLF